MRDSFVAVLLFIEGLDSLDSCEVFYEESLCLTRDNLFECLDTRDQARHTILQTKEDQEETQLLTSYSRDGDHGYPLKAGQFMTSSP